LIFLIVFLTMGLIALSKISPNGLAKTAAVVATTAIVAVVTTTGEPGKWLPRIAGMSNDLNWVLHSPSTRL
tara:strand:- start:71 stop:283 length:213 start_codon:yes stop_codon:yes gene_type:complete